MIRLIHAWRVRRAFRAYDRATTLTLRASCEALRTVLIDPPSCAAAIARADALRTKRDALRAKYYALLSHP